ncbi:MAG TPA: hypothetical protein VIC31_00845 [Rudaea sp.]
MADVGKPVTESVFVIDRAKPESNNFAIVEEVTLRDAHDLLNRLPIGSVHDKGGL